MRHIAIVGPPNSGKSELADGLWRFTTADLDAPRFEMRTIDKYVEELETEADIALGHFATPIGNMMIASQRIQWERCAAADGAQCIVTCGTILETMIYNTLWGMQAQKLSAEPGYNVWLMDSMLQAFAGVMAETWHYDLVFHLPYSEEQKEERDGNLDAQLDEELYKAFEIFHIADVKHLTGTDEEKLGQAVEELEKLEAATTD